jgi:antirestriction protein ArdC
MNSRDREDIYSRVTNHILQAIEAGVGSYRMPWHVSSANSFSPVNVASEKSYRGVNVLCLWATAEIRGYPSGLWGTYRQWRELGAQVREGEKATPVVFWNTKEVEQEEESGEQRQKEIVLARGYSVFNVSQVDGFIPPEAPKLSEATRVEAAERFLTGAGADIRHGGDRAFYDPKADYVQVPSYEAFRSAHGYYSTLAHELTHWSGAPNRLARDLSGRFGSQAYAAEELVAELGAAFTLAKLGLSSEPRPDHACYIAPWISLLKSDNRAIFTAASKAQKAVDWLTQRHERLLADREQTTSPELDHNYEISR